MVKYSTAVPSGAMHARMCHSMRGMGSAPQSDPLKHCHFWHVIRSRGTESCKQVGLRHCASHNNNNIPATYKFQMPRQHVVRHKPSQAVDRCVLSADSDELERSRTSWLQTSPISMCRDVPRAAGGQILPKPTHRPDHECEHIRHSGGPKCSNLRVLARPSRRVDFNFGRRLCRSPEDHVRQGVSIDSMDEKLPQSMKNSASAMKQYYSHFPRRMNYASACTRCVWAATATSGRVRGPTTARPSPASLGLSL